VSLDLGGVAKKILGEYWVVNQILAKQLHTTSEEMLSYTTKLMDKLEEVSVCFVLVPTTLAGR
jgi:hypothetical protein